MCGVRVCVWLSKKTLSLFTKLLVVNKIKFFQQNYCSELSKTVVKVKSSVQRTRENQNPSNFTQNFLKTLTREFFIESFSTSSAFRQIWPFFTMETPTNGNADTSDEEMSGQNEICCLIEDGNKCRRPAGNASFSKRIQKTVQRKLKLSLDTYVSQRWHSLAFKIFMTFNLQARTQFICDFHKSKIQSARSKRQRSLRPGDSDSCDSDIDSPEVDFYSLQVSTLRKVSKKMFLVTQNRNFLILFSTKSSTKSALVQEWTKRSSARLYPSTSAPSRSRRRRFSPTSSTAWKTMLIRMDTMIKRDVVRF